MGVMQGCRGHCYKHVENVFLYSPEEGNNQEKWIGVGEIPEIDCQIDSITLDLRLPFLVLLLVLSGGEGCKEGSCGHGPTSFPQS